jgi:capsular exopolysaccharide synthesis family protein
MSTPTDSPSQVRREAVAEERVDVRRYLDALRRSRLLIVLIVAGMTGTVVAVSLALPDTYRATARIVFEQSTSPLGDTDAASTQRRLATTEMLLTAPDVLTRAARSVPGETKDALEDKVESSVDEQANIINVVVSDGDADDAATLANAVARAFLSERTQLDRERIARARQRLLDEIERLENEGSPNADVQIGAIRERISELGVSEASAGSELQIAERAEAPSSAASPRPLRNGVLALFASLFLAVLVALGRDQLIPRLSGPRELGRLLDLPVLIGIPYVRQRFGRRRGRVMSGVEAEAYQTLRATVEFSLPPTEKPLILMTGAVHAEGKTTATARLGRALARAGHRTLLVSADLRVPKLHQLFGVPLGVGLADILAVLDWEKGELDRSVLERATNVVTTSGYGKEGRGELHVITSGTPAKDPGHLISSPAMQAFVDELRGLDYDYVLIDAPPLLGMPDSQVLSQRVDEMVIVSRLDRLRLDQVSDLREVLDRLTIKPLGLVVIGARGEVSPYYLARRPSVIESEARARA